MNSPMRVSVPSRIIVLAAFVLQGCATQSPIDPALMSFDQSRLPPADVTLNIAGLGPCTDNPDRSLRLNSREPVTVLVHGCYGSSGQFRGLAQLLAFHGQQSACFTYDDRASMDVTGAELATAVDRLVKQSNVPQVTVIGHSQGALVARRSLTDSAPKPIGSDSTRLSLVTISGPFAGIASANACGSPTLRVLSLGLIAPMCSIVTGDKWSEITYSSDFIRRPGDLIRQVQSHLKIDTDERGSCRQRVDDKCAEDDHVFSLDEQRNPVVDRHPVTKVVEVQAGHVEIVGDKYVAPVKLIAVLQQSGVMRATEPQRVTAFDQLLARLYGDTPTR